ncbi:hypothetical protein FRC10_012003 [Ceratobasidium sp. 414]|nr:hypothetical protein FRC10_012003 [Ceratobasidium sp. 414]
MREAAPAANPSKPTAKGLLANKATALQKRPIIPRARVDAICEAAKACESAVGAPANRIPVPSGSATNRAPHNDPQPPPTTDMDTEMAGPEDDLAPNTGEGQPRHGTPPAKEEADAEDAGNSTRTGRQHSQLHAFGEEASELVDWVMERVRVEMAMTCPFPEILGPPENNNQSYLDLWVPKLWVGAHAALRPDLPRLRLKDRYVVYIRSQLSPTRNRMKKACDGILSTHFGLHFSHPDHKVKATQITQHEKWLSPIRHLIQAFELGKTKAGNLSGTQNAGTFKTYMTMLEEFSTQNPGCLLNARMEIMLEYLKAHPAPTPIEMTMGPDQDVNEDNLEEIKALHKYQSFVHISDLTQYLGDAVPDINKWQEMQVLTQNKKGKGKARAGAPSRAA